MEEGKDMKECAGLVNVCFVELPKDRFEGMHVMDGVLQIL